MQKLKFCNSLDIMKNKAIIALFWFFFSSVYIVAQVIPAAEFSQSERIELRYPVILVHGIARSDRGDRQAWGRIPTVLRESGIEVFYGYTDAWGDVASNARLLKATVDNILATTNHERVNIIAHSKGGIDSRYFIWRYDYGDRVASLTTLSTPHGGSEIADFLYQLRTQVRILDNENLRRRLGNVGRLFGDLNPDFHNVNRDLTTENMERFNAMVTKDPRVFYQVIYSVMKDSGDDSMYSLSHAFIRNISGENDGLVSAKSARWGDNPIRLPISLSHRQMTDLGGDNGSSAIVLNIYLGIVRDLARKGF